MSLRRDPYKLFFPLGLLCGWLGVSHWFFYGFGYIPAYSGLGHALILTGAMLGAFAYGFLLTMVPRRTQTQPAHWIEIALGIVAIVITAVAANRNKIEIAAYGYAAQMAVLMAFSARRTESKSATRRPPATFVLIPMACAAGIAGAVFIVRMYNGQGSLEAYLIGRELIQQAVYLCLLVGVGSLIVPLIFGNPVPPDLDDSRRSLYGRVAFFALGAAIIATCALSPWAPRLTIALRAVVVAIALFATGVARWPGKPGAHRWLVALAAWLAPVGLAGAALFPKHSIAGMHVMFIGSIGLLVFAVSAHVTMGHGDRTKLMNGWSVRAVCFGALTLTALGMRATAHLWPEHYFTILGVASAVWIAGSMAWLGLLVAGLRGLPDAQTE